MFGMSDVPVKTMLATARMSHYLMIFQDTLNMIVSSLALDNDTLARQLRDFGAQHAFYTRRSYDPTCWAAMGAALTELAAELPSSATGTSTRWLVRV